VKLIIAILNDEDAETSIQNLVEAEFRVTRVASTGGFLRRGSTTMFIGTEEERVEEAIERIREASRSAEKAGQRRGVVFVLNMARFEQL
jgi:uncharacterized protein YaaQ